MPVSMERSLSRLTDLFLVSQYDILANSCSLKAMEDILKLYLFYLTKVV